MVVVVVAVAVAVVVAVVLDLAAAGSETAPAGAEGLRDLEGEAPRSVSSQARCCSNKSLAPLDVDGRPAPARVLVLAMPLSAGRGDVGVGASTQLCSTS